LYYRLTEKGNYIYSKKARIHPLIEIRGVLRAFRKYDLLQKINIEPENAWEQLEAEAKQLSVLGADYILVHFPYFKEEIIGI
jgi:hypothetical protein